ncbi:MAG: hypothetical protein RL547_1423 [Actinomycetota bacterium]
MTSSGRGSLYLAAGSFLDLDASGLIDLAGDLAGDVAGDLAGDMSGTLAGNGADFAGVGLRLSGEHLVADSRSAVSLRRRLEAVGKRVFDVEVIRVSSGFDMYSATTLIERAAELGARYVLAVSDLSEPGSGTTAPGSTAAGPSALDRSIEVFAALQQRADQAGLSIAVEYMAWTTPSDVAGALKVHQSTGCRIVVDLLHHARIGATASDLELLVRSGAIAWVQLCDAPAERRASSLVEEARHGRLVPGTGGLPLGDFLGVIPSTIDVSIEVQSDDLLSLTAIDRARRLIAASRELLG